MELTDSVIRGKEGTDGTHTIIDNGGGGAPPLLQLGQSTRRKHQWRVHDIRAVTVMPSSQGGVLGSGSYIRLKTGASEEG